VYRNIADGISGLSADPPPKPFPKPHCQKQRHAIRHDEHGYRTDFAHVPRVPTLKSPASSEEPKKEGAKKEK
jgi:hypothetical protein